MKIINRKSLGKQKVYDIGVAQDHNFILANGLVASNCFNKSHSTAYGYVTYQTAYLKANYPVEYMAALLTANSDDQDKVQKYIANCQNLNIEIEPPNINRSDVDFTPFDKKIIFGLSAVKNLGSGAVENILKWRQEKGEYKSLADLCDRIDLKLVNSRALEALVKSGALDCLNPNRKQALAHLEKLVIWAQNRAKEREIGQYNLFDMLNGFNTQDNFESAPKAPKMEDYSTQDKLQFEKELLGFYISDHPLKAVSRSRYVEGVLTIEELGNQKSKATVKLWAMINSVKLHNTKEANKRMAFIQLEDINSQIEAVVFPKTYDVINSLLIANSILLITGKIDKRDDKIQIIVEEVKAPDDVAQNVNPTIKLDGAAKIEDADLTPDKQAEMLILYLKRKEIENRESIDHLKMMLKEYSSKQSSADLPVGAIVEGEYHRKLVKFGQEFWVESDEIVDRLKSDGFDTEILIIDN
jgi:DNA polymerase-3 subunit alpha